MKFPMGLLVMVLILMCGCQPKGEKLTSQQEEKGCVKINISYDPQTLDPRKSRGLNERILINMLFDGLMRRDKNGEIEPALAERVEMSSDSKVYTFHIRDAYWTNGDPVLASDFVYAWKKVLDPKFPTENAYQMYCIKNAKAVKQGDLPSEKLGISALDEKTFRVELEEPVPYFFDLLTFSIFFPVHPSIDAPYVNEEESLSHFVSCGPFRLSHWKHNDSIRVLKNERYWDGPAVRLSEIEMSMLPVDTEIQMFETKELDWAGSPMSTLSPDVLMGLKKKGILKSQPLLGTYFFRINTGKPPFDQPSLRRAFALAINRKAIVEHVIQGNQVPATGLVPEIMGIQTKSYFQDYNLEEARDLFDKAMRETGLTKETFPEVSLLYGTSQRNHVVAQAVQQQWLDAFGIKVKLEAMEAKVYFDRLNKQDYQLASSSWIADFNDPINFLEVFKYSNGSTNNTRWENKQYIDFLNGSNSVNDRQKRKNLLSQCEAILMEEMPIIPLYHMALVFVQNEHLKDVVMSPIGDLDFKWAYLENAK